MNYLLHIELKKLAETINYRDKIFLAGSCFTEHIGHALHEMKFSVLQNPHGILFDPNSVSRSLQACVQSKQYKEEDLFQLNEVWNSWDHHSRFSGIDASETLQHMNESVKEAHHFLEQADWIILTLGSSFSYRLLEDTNGKKGEGVANCHRAPAQWFRKYLLSIPEITGMLENCCREILQFNPRLKFIFTVSPVRHIRDGVVENNRSKARLIESVHRITEIFPQAYYFPAYELVIDVLRDYRFYDIDLVHPNYAATEFVLEKFSETCLSPDTSELMEEVRKIVTARKHKAFQPATLAHRQFLTTHYEKTLVLQAKYPFLHLEEELTYFSP